MSSTAAADRDLAIGKRVRDQRVLLPMSQTQLANAVGLSASYVSLIESGRRTATPDTVERLAAVLGCTAEYLRTGRGSDLKGELELDLRFAEMALRSGDAAPARARFTKVRDAAGKVGRWELVLEARWGEARAAESLGAVQEAIEQYEALASDNLLPDSIGRAVVLNALCRTYRECGDLGRAIDVGEAAVQELATSDSSASLSDEAVALASTLVGCYYERGDLTRAHLLGERTLAQADANGSAQARSSAFWNAALVSEARCDLSRARQYIERALALSSETDNARATALLRVATAWVLLREPKPKLAEAERLLAQAITDLPEVGTALDLAYAHTEQARCNLLRGDWRAALTTAEAVLERLRSDGPRLEAARARLLVGDSHLAGGDIQASIDAYSAAATELRSSGAHRQAAVAWRELAERLLSLGRTDQALDAYRAASDAIGLPSPVPPTGSIPAAPAAARSHRR